MNKIVECIPNFSEGRRAEVVDQIVSAITSVRGAVVLDREMDASHNRSVITYVAEPQTAVEAAVRAAATAAKLIDLNQHKGEHPRMGATDVIPFVPIQGVTMEDCIELARATGRRLAQELGIPVYLYEKAATRPDRENLADVRKGEFEGIREEIQTNPARRPDFGEPRVHPTAGATAVGARPPLIAYNVNLNTNNLDVAKKVAKAVRYSSGGLRYVKALGFELKDRGIVQVSMNLVNFEGTPIFRAFEMVKREAAVYGVNVLSSEIVGLVPQAALDACAEYYLQLENFRRDQILENRLKAALEQAVGSEPTAQAATEQSPSLSQSIGSFPDLVAAGTPTPGGGSVSALCGVLAASLGQMMCNLTAGKKKFAGVEGEVRSIASELENLRESLQQAISEDAESFERVMNAYRLPKETEGERLARETAIEEALKGAAAAPLRMAEHAIQVLELLVDLSEIGNPNAFTDLAVGGQLALTAVKGAYYNIATNLNSISDEEFKQEHQSKAKEMLERAEELAARVEQALTSRVLK